METGISKQLLVVLYDVVVGWWYFVVLGKKHGKKKNKSSGIEKIVTCLKNFKLFFMLKVKYPSAPLLCYSQSAKSIESAYFLLHIKSGT